MKDLSYNRKEGGMSEESFNKVFKHLDGRVLQVPIREFLKAL